MTQLPPGSAESAARPRLTLAAVLIGIGIILGPGLITAGVLMAIRSTRGGAQFAVPGEIVITADGPRSYVVWHETRGVFNGTVHVARSGDVAGLQVVVTPKDAGEPIPVRPSTGGTMTVGGTQRESLVTFEVPSAGEYRVSVTGAGPDRVFYVAPDFLLSLILTILATSCGGLVGVGCLIAGVVLLVVALARRSGHTVAR